MKRTIALAAVALLAGCASDGYYYGGGYSGYRYDDRSPYVYETYPAYPYGYGYGGYPYYDAGPAYYGGPVIGGGIYYYDRGDRRRDHRRDDDPESRRWRDSDRVEAAPAERADPGNVVRPRGGPPGERVQR